MVRLNDGEEIACLVNDEIDKITNLQRRIGLIAYPFRNDKLFLEAMATEYGNLDYVKQCIKQYEATKDIIYIKSD